MEGLQITPTISAGTILLILSFMGTFLGSAITIYFKLKEKWLTNQMDMEDRLKKHQEILIEAQTAKLEECIHKIAGHPEHPEDLELANESKTQ